MLPIAHIVLLVYVQVYSLVSKCYTAVPRYCCLLGVRVCRIFIILSWACRLLPHLLCWSQERLAALRGLQAVSFRIFCSNAASRSVPWSALMTIGQKPCGQQEPRYVLSLSIRLVRRQTVALRCALHALRHTCASLVLIL